MTGRLDCDSCPLMKRKPMKGGGMAPQCMFILGGDREAPITPAQREVRTWIHEDDAFTSHEGPDPGNCPGHPDAKRLSRAEFIANTVGAEVKRACDFAGDCRLFDEFTAALPEMEPTLRMVDVQWWRPDDEYVQGSRYQLSEPGKRLIVFPGSDPGPYVADGPLPPEPGWSLEIVAYFAETDASRYMVQSGDGQGRRLTKRELAHAVNGIMRARTFR